MIDNLKISNKLPNLDEEELENDDSEKEESEDEEENTRNDCLP